MGADISSKIILTDSESDSESDTECERLLLEALGNDILETTDTESGKVTPNFLQENSLLPVISNIKIPRQ